MVPLRSRPRSGSQEMVPIHIFLASYQIWLRNGNTVPFGNWLQNRKAIPISPIAPNCTCLLRSLVANYIILPFLAYGPTLLSLFFLLTSVTTISFYPSLVLRRLQEILKAYMIPSLLYNKLNLEYI